MYCSNFICTYLDYKSKDDEEYIQDQLYRSQFLQAFGLENWDDDIINKTASNVLRQTNKSKTNQTTY